MNTIFARCILICILIGALTACDGGVEQFRLLLVLKAPAEPRSGDTLYDPLDVKTWSEILQSRSFYDKHLRAQLNRLDYHGTWEDFWRSVEVIPEVERYALIVVFHNQVADVAPKRITEALSTALNEYYFGEASSGKALPSLVKAIERVK